MNALFALAQQAQAPLVTASDPVDAARIETDIIYAREILAAHRSKLSPEMQRTAGDLLSRWNPSPAQAKFIRSLARQAALPKPAAVAVANVRGIIALLSRGADNLKHPAIVIDDGEGASIRLSIAGERAKEPGSVTVTGTAKTGMSPQGFPTRDWYGRVSLAGAWEPSNRLTLEQSTAIAALLGKLASDPAGTAASYGRRTGCCCFCNRALTDARSIAVGYGPTCADNYGLPWGELPGTADEFVHTFAGIAHRG